LTVCVSQGSVATQLRCGGILNNHFIANCTESVPVKEFGKSVNNWQRYGQYQVWRFFETQCSFADLWQIFKTNRLGRQF